MREDIEKVTFRPRDNQVTSTVGTISTINLPVALRYVVTADFEGKQAAY